MAEKMVELSAVEFDRFCQSMLERYPFIREISASLHYDGGMRHGFLVLGIGRNDGILVDPQGADYARYSAFVPNARSLLTPNMAIDRSYLSPAEPWRDERRDEMLRMTLRVDGKSDYTLILPTGEKYLDAVKACLGIDVFTDTMLCDIRFKVPYIGELTCDTDCPAVEDYEDALHHNCVFVGMDENGEAKHAHPRSTNSQGKVFRINVEGSEAKHSFHKDGALYVFEAPIDLLSHITLYPAGWLEHSYVACCGTSVQPVLERLRQNPKLNMVYLCLDNDEAGEDACG